MKCRFIIMKHTLMKVFLFHINQMFNKCIGKRFNVYLTKEKANILNNFKNVIPLGKISYTLQGIIAGNEKYIQTLS